jgi:hypothetical protein
MDTEQTAATSDTAFIEHMMTLHDFLKNHAKTQTQAILDLIKKLPEKTINALLMQVYQGDTLLGLAAHKSEIIFQALIKKSKPLTVNQAVSLPINIEHFFYLIDYGKHESITALLAPLEPKTIDFLMSQPNVEGNALFLMARALFYAHPLTKIAIEQAYGALLERTSLFTLTILAQQAMPHQNGQPVPLLTGLVSWEAPQKLIDAILSRLTEEVKNDLFLNKTVRGMPFLQKLSYVLENCKSMNHPSTDITKQKNIASVYIIHHINVSTLWMAINQSLNPEELTPFEPPELWQAIIAWEKRPVEIRRMDFFRRVSADKPLLFNALIEKLFLAKEQYVFELLPAYVYRLNAANISLYLAKNANVTKENLENFKAHPFLLNWKYEHGFKSRAGEAAESCHQEITLPLATYCILKYKYIGEAPTQVVLDYLVINDTMRRRINLEVQKIKELYDTQNPHPPHFYLPIFGKKLKKRESCEFQNLIEIDFSALTLKSPSIKTPKS